MGNAFSAYLPHFSAGVFSGIDLGGALKPLSGEGGLPPANDPIAEAEARGRSAAEAAAKLKFENLRAEDQADLEFQLAEKEEFWRRETADVLVAAMTAGLLQIETAIADHAARAIVRLLDGAIRERALAELSQTLTMLLAGHVAAKIMISGPQALIERLREPLAGRDVEFVPDSRPDVVVKIDDTAIETCIAAWAGRVETAVAGIDDV